MCGIAGLYALANADRPTAAELTAMIRQLHHRGPDGATVTLAGPAGLAHARLSLLDLAGGEQPFATPDGAIQVVCNGEIFNHAALRHELAASGVTFHTRCDIEVLPHLYARHGDRFLDRLDGQFAIAVWDARRRRLLLARDRFGIRPLFYTRHRGRLAFASEIKALLTLPGLRARLDPVGLSDVLSTWGTLSPTTMFEGISALGAGERLVSDATGTRVESWWSWRPAADPTLASLDDGALADQLRALLEAAVERQMVADAPVAVAISGGIDSAAVAALACRVARRQGRETPSSFGLVFDDAEFDESSWQQALAAEIGTDHHAVRCSIDDIADGFARMVWHAETPLIRTAPVPMAHLAAAMRKAGFRAILTGEAADELFAGYDLFKEARIRRFAAANADPQGRARLLDRLYPYLGRAPAAAGRLGRLTFLADLSRPHAADFAHRTRIAATRRTLATLTPEWRAAVNASVPRDRLAARMPAGFETWSDLARDQFVEADSLLSAHLLCSQGDRPAMSASIETRLPFLDHALIDFASRLPDRLKLRGLADKRLLRMAMQPVLPAMMVSRPKQPYRAPEARCFFTDGQPRPWVADLLSKDTLFDAGIFDPAVVERLTAKFAAGRGSDFAESTALVVILSTQVLVRQFITGSTPVRPESASLPVRVRELAFSPEMP